MKDTTKFGVSGPTAAETLRTIVTTTATAVLRAIVAVATATAMATTTGPSDATARFLQHWMRAWVRVHHVARTEAAHVSTILHDLGFRA